MKALNIIVFNGLCNRLRALDSAIALGQHRKMAVNLYWSLGHGLYCDFNDLFERPDGLNTLTQWRFDSIRERNLIKLKIGWQHWNGAVKLGAEDIDHLLNTKQDINEFLDQKASTPQHIIIRTHERFFTNPDAFQYLQPIATLQEKIDHVCGGFSADTVGVHIRNTDQKKSRETSTLPKFIAAMEAEIDRNQEVQFFLASDDFAVNKVMEQKFGSRILFYEKTSVNRNEPKAIQDALVELYSLSKTCCIFGSYWSSFSETAAELSGIPLQVIQ